LYTYGDARVDSLISTSLRYFHVNFADANLFGFYGGSLLAQDELQVLEIPMLAQWRERLLKDKSMAAEARTMDNVGCTPAVITNVPRLGSLDTGEMGELYGNNFRVASFDDVNKHFEIAKSLRVAPRANVIAMAAARGSRGKYTASDVKFLLETCCAAFDGATRVVKQDELVGIHTGFWVSNGARWIFIVIELLVSRRLIFRGFSSGLRCIWRQSNDEHSRSAVRSEHLSRCRHRVSFGRR
jgi:hypothetical protein